MRNENYRILSLDGGGAKGFYTLGVLKELEALLGRKICESFDLVFGTSTGSIIAALLALGLSVNEVHQLYRENLPSVMQQKSKAGRSAALATLADKVFSNKTFQDVKMRVGIVATRWALEKPMIFKGSVAQAHGRHPTFIPGFGCTISEAVQGSCSAYPFFLKKSITTQDGNTIELIDGGYCANDPTLYAIADASIALKKAHSTLRVVSLGVGHYPEPKSWNAPKRWLPWLYSRLTATQLLQKTLSVNTASMEQLREILYKDVQTVRISDSFPHPELATDLLESDLTKLDAIHQRGRESFGKREADLKKLLGLGLPSQAVGEQ